MKKLKTFGCLCLLITFSLLAGCINYYGRQLEIKNNWQNKYRSFEKIESEHFIFYVPEGDHVNITAQEWFYKHITTLFGVEPEKKIIYIKCKYPEDIQKITDERAIAVAYAPPYPKNTIISSRRYDDHELIHIIQALISRSTSFFEEGLARAYESYSYLRIYDDPQKDFWLHSYLQNTIIEGGYYISIVEILTSKEFRTLIEKNWVIFLLVGTTYTEAGSFTRYLIDVYGLETFFQFLKISNYSDSKSEIEEKFLRVYSISIQEKEKQWLNFLEENY